MPDSWLTVREAAALLKVSTATVYKLRRTGALPFTRVFHAIRISAAALHAFTSQGRPFGHDEKTPCRACARATVQELAAELMCLQASVRARLAVLRKQASAGRAELDAAMRRRPKGERLRCGARCRDGHACQAAAYWPEGAHAVRNGRCRMHGGLSTGPRTEEGKARVAEAARRTLLSRRASANVSNRGGS